MIQFQKIHDRSYITEPSASPEKINTPAANLDGRHFQEI